MSKEYISYCTKDNLYEYVNCVKKRIEVNQNNIESDLYNKCEKEFRLKMDIVPFTNKLLRGMSIPKENIIILNSSRTSAERNFDFAHELIHVIKHKYENHQTFQCVDCFQPTQNLFLEWQANEGAAEMLVPYKAFIPLFCANVVKCTGFHDYKKLKEELAEHFQVPVTVIELRIDNLKYEIQQFEQGCDVNHLCILSNNEQLRRGINVPSYNMKFEFYDLIV